MHLTVCVTDGKELCSNFWMIMWRPWQGILCCQSWPWLGPCSGAFGLHLALLQTLASSCIVDFALASLSAASITNFAMTLLKVLPINTEAVDLLQAPCTIGIVE